MNKVDVYAFGVVSASTLYRLDGSFPATEGYGEITSSHFMTGGEATNSAIVLSALGASVKLDGSRLGDTDAGLRVKALLDKAGIDSSRLSLTQDYGGTEEVVFAAENTRTIFGTYGRLHADQQWNAPDEADVTAAKVVCLDPFFDRASAEAARIAAGAGIPVITVDTRHDDPLLADVSAIVVSGAFIREQYPDSDREALFRRYLEAVQGLVIFTFGDQPLWFGRTPGQLETFQPFPVDVLDTSGAGDSFRAGVVYGYLQDWDDRQTVEFSAATAALICSRFPGVQDPPDAAEVLEFLDVRKARSAEG